MCYNDKEKIYYKCVFYLACSAMCFSFEPNFKAIYQPKMETTSNSGRFHRITFLELSLKLAWFIARNCFVLYVPKNACEQLPDFATNLWISSV